MSESGDTMGSLLPAAPASDDRVTPKAGLHPDSADLPARLGVFATAQPRLGDIDPRTCAGTYHALLPPKFRKRRKRRRHEDDQLDAPRRPHLGEPLA